jgi:hypothetical protein
VTVGRQLLAAGRGDVEVVLDDPGRSDARAVRGRPGGPGAPSPAAALPTSSALDDAALPGRRRPAVGQGVAQRGSPATIRSNRKSSSSTASARPAASAPGEQRLHGEVLDGVAEVALGAQRWLGQRRRPAPMAWLADLAGPNRRSRRARPWRGPRGRVGQGPAQRGVGVQRRADPKRSSASAAERRRRPARLTGVEALLARGDRAREDPCIRTSLPILTFSGAISPASSSARKRSTMPFWRTSSCSDSPTIGWPGRSTAADLTTQRDDGLLALGLDLRWAARRCARLGLGLGPHLGDDLRTLGASVLADLVGLAARILRAGRCTGRAPPWPRPGPARPCMPPSMAAARSA